MTYTVKTLRVCPSCQGKPLPEGVGECGECGGTGRFAVRSAENIDADLAPAYVRDLVAGLPGDVPRAVERWLERFAAGELTAGELELAGNVTVTVNRQSG